MRLFAPTRWATQNRTTIYALTILITLFGIGSYITLPKELFPDLVIPTIVVNTVYPGSSPSDIENLITRPIEKRLKGVAGIEKINSYSQQDVSTIVVEFSVSEDPKECKDRVKDAVDKARADLPRDLPQEPTITDVDFSEFPIMSINLAGDYSPVQLKKYADELKDRIEALPQIRRVDIVGALEREIRVDVDMTRLQAHNLAFSDIEGAISRENVLISAGEADLGRQKRTLRLDARFRSVEEIRNLIVRSGFGASVYLRDVADVYDGYKKRESYAFLDGKPVITLNVIKKSGENLVEAADAIFALIGRAQREFLPPNLRVVITNDQSERTRVQLDDLVNTIIIGFILVTVVMMFFIGLENALFVGLSVPLSSFVAFLAFPTLGYSLNLVVLFTFLLALGIVVDDAIVVVENTYRLFDNGRVPILQAAQVAATEVFIPVLSGTLITAAPFVPLLFWESIPGKFLYYLPVTFLITLFASLLVAYIINPVFAVDFMRPVEAGKRKVWSRGFLFTLGLIALAAGVFYLAGWIAMGNFTLTLIGLFIAARTILRWMITGFQEKVLPSFMKGHRRILHWSIQRGHPKWVLLGVLGLFILGVILFAARPPKVSFFPNRDPNYIYAYLKLPEGTSADYTNQLAELAYKKVKAVLGESNPLVTSVLVNVGVGSGDPFDRSSSSAPNRAKITIAFVEFRKREGRSTRPYLDSIYLALRDIPGVTLQVEPDRAGPPAGKPIQIEVSSEDPTLAIRASQLVKSFLDSLRIPGIQELNSDLVLSRPEIRLLVDRERTQRAGLSAAQLGGELRTALYGKEASKLRDKEDEYPIQIRYKEDYQRQPELLLTHRIVFRDMSDGRLKQYPLSSFATLSYGSGQGLIRRKNLKRTITISSDVLPGYNATDINNQIRRALQALPLPKEVSVKIGGEQEEQGKAAAFLQRAFLLAVGGIFLILIAQFNSVGIPLIILSQVFFSLIGVIWGFALTQIEFSVVLAGVGIVALLGVVIKNGILLVEFIEELRGRGYRTRRAIVEGASIRLKPVLLTAASTVLGLIPLAVGFNIDFVSLFETGDPKIFFGGDTAFFWLPLASAIIFGLSFATVITLIVVPVLYYMLHAGTLRWRRWLHRMKYNYLRD
ncbi:MAG: efflux RND transporter permease subunit [Bacteroidia bacterium]|nr:efflux RND transporter permease subunit [Bacteroidia bacterium]MDW8417248.1 efflux RND transporter permease subunit [Bacteroidia bacterium]